MTWTEVDREIIICEDGCVECIKPDAEIMQERMLLSAAVLIVTNALSMWIGR
jgi:hypothetical protein